MDIKEAERRVKILSFWKKHGLEATREAYGVSRASLFRWQQTLKRSQGRIHVLAPKSRAPIRRRKRIIPKEVEKLIITERQREKLGKEKLAVLLCTDKIAALSASTVGRMLSDLKILGRLPNPTSYSLYGNTGNLIEKKPRKYKKKLRSKGHAGGLVKADTIVRFHNGMKRYILTALDLESEFAFAFAYSSHASKAAADFMYNFRSIAPVSLTHIQTDNGSEFENHFELFCEQENVVHFHTYPRSPKMNAEIERFNRTLSEAFIQWNKDLLSCDLEAFNKALMDWLLWYNARRPHWSIGLISPLRYICNKLTLQKSHMLWTSTG